MRLQLLIGILLLASTLLLLQHIALAEFLYWRWWWFDILMHFLGGVLIGGLALVTSMTFGINRAFTFVVLFFAIGVGWEIFERTFGLYRAYGYFGDTLLDLLMDALGAAVVYSAIKLWK